MQAMNAPVSASPRIALIHATALSMPPIDAAFERLWPQAQRMHLLDDSLSRDRARDGGLTPAMVSRFIDLASYAKRTGAEAILFTCSAFGPAIEAAAQAVAIPTLKPNEALFAQALERGRCLGLVVTFEPSLDSLAQELREMAARRGAAIELRTVFVPEAMQELALGRPDDHHRRIAEAAGAFGDCDAVLLGQFS
ncbi:MAG TPA: aspartate/glutamate racemase family protein, partial [Methylibium sp.]|nr:aspartate/glutamate racemase family protein [Methylibium sp.]